MCLEECVSVLQVQRPTVLRVKESALEKDSKGVVPCIWTQASMSSNLITYLSLKLFMVHWAIKCTISKRLLEEEVDLFVLVTTPTKVYFSH